MNPWVPDTANRQQPSQAYPPRSWSNDLVPAYSRSRPPQSAYGARSASFSDSRPSLPNWNDLPPPPPVPPLPPSLFSAFRSPAQTHSDRDLFFTEAPRPAKSFQQWSHPPFAGPGPAYHTNNHIPSFAPQWPSEQSSNPHPDEAPAIPPRPAHPNRHVHTSDPQAEAAARPMSYAPTQPFYTDPSSPPSIPQRPMTMHGDIRPIDTGSAPALPSKPFTPLPPITRSDSVPPPTPTKDRFLSSSYPLEASKAVKDDFPPFPHILAEATKLGSGHSRTQSAEDIVRAMELSLVESQPPKIMLGEEDRDLQRALADSLAEASPFFRSTAESNTLQQSQLAERNNARLQRTPPPVAGPSGEAKSVTADREAEVAAKQLQSERDDREALRNLKEKEERLAKENRELEQRDEEAKRLQRERDGKAAIRKLMKDEEERQAREKRAFELRDEEMARQQAEEENRARLEEQEAQEAQERRDREIARRQVENEEIARREEQQAQERRDAEMARRLAGASEAGPSRIPMSAPVAASTYVSGPTSVAPGPKPSSSPGQRPASGHKLSPATVAPNRRTSSQPPPGPPQYNDVVNSRPVAISDKKIRPRLSQASIQSSPLPPGSTSQTMRTRAISAIAAPPQERPEFARSSTVGGGAVTAHTSTQIPSTSGREGSAVSPRPLSSNVAGPSTAAAAHAHANGPVPPPKARPETQNSPPSNNAGPLRASGAPASQGENAEPELLKGVSFGFEAPKTNLAPVQISELPPCPPFPEVISLHPAPAPSFHIMALSWRHLMRLLAQFETRIEATVSAIAQTKDESVLRVAVQFVKLPYTANEWRTILHLSIDQPVPATVPQAWRFTNGDTTVLPYSFALGETPSHLQISATAHLYVVPLSAATPFPILPIALPNLALYLQSAMRDSRSRKVQSDTSNGTRRLARIVGTCYPEEVLTAEPEERESGRGMGGLFKRVVGGGRKRRDTQGNEDVYDMVTPFRIDKYTTVA